MAAIHSTGEAVSETSYYGQLESLLNDIGSGANPKVMCVLTSKNRGAGIPDGGLFTRRNAVVEAGPSAMEGRSPEHGALEVKGPAEQVDRVARSRQVKKYLDRYGQVLVTNYREFRQVRLGGDGSAVFGEHFELASTQHGFWELAESWSDLAEDVEADFCSFLRRVLLADAPLSSPADLAWFLAHYARTGRDRLDSVGELERLTILRGAFEDALGLRFEGEEGESFFRSALVQTLFYGVFAAWVVWSEDRDESDDSRFSWRAAQWTLEVPMVRVLFSEIAMPANLPMGLDEVLDWTEETLNRVDRKLFFERFEPKAAVPYFYEPFLQEYDPELRKQMGVWYTPPQVVRYMLQRVHRTLQDDFGLKLGLADPSVHFLDPCTGTGSFLTEALELIYEILEEDGSGFPGEEVEAAALERLHGFELLPAPFVIAHLQVGLALDRLGAPLVDGAGERPSIYLTNSLTGWLGEEGEQPALPFPELQAEREAAEAVKQVEPILVVIGNPPYNGFAGVSGEDEGALVEPYKENLARDWEITKNKLDDLYVRFFRVAERRIAEQTGKGIVCFISNNGWLSDPSTVVMRQHILRQFNRIEIDNLNGDSRETGKKTPEGAPDPSIFSTSMNPAGIQVGTAISLLSRTGRVANGATCTYRDWWGAEKLNELAKASNDLNGLTKSRPLGPNEKNWFRLRPWEPREGYDEWPSITDLAGDDPLLGLNENRGEGLIDHDEDALAARMEAFLDPELQYEELPASAEALREPWTGFDSKRVRARLAAESPFDRQKIVPFQVRPLDVRWAYVDTAPGLWNRSRPELVAAAKLESGFVLARRRAPRALDGAALLFSNQLIDQHVMHKDAYAVPLWLASPDAETQAGLFDELDEGKTPTGDWHPNLSKLSRAHLTQLGVEDFDSDQDAAALLWMHALAIAYSPLYLEENGDAIRADWPRIPIPDDPSLFKRSVALGERIARLLDVDNPVPGIETAVAPYLRHVGEVRANDGTLARASDLSVTAGWASIQRREQKSGAVSRIVMPGGGAMRSRPRDASEEEVLSDGSRELLGEEVLDVALNERIAWRGVPQAAWDYKIGGFAVLRKWLSYREESVIGRAITVIEARRFTFLSRRLTEVVLLGPELDRNYLAVTGVSPQENQLWGAGSGEETSDQTLPRAGL